MRALARARARLCACALLAVVCAALSACGGGVILQDDFAVMRSGNVAGAHLKMIVNDAGTVTCNGAKPVPISDKQLVQARYISMTMATQASAGLNLRPGPHPVFHYAVQTPDGHVSFSDDSPHTPSILDQLQLLILQIAQSDCHLAR